MPSLSVGIVGLPNVGKSTLFNALLKESQAEVSNYPFCTIDPNIGIVKVPDDRLEKLQKTLQKEKKIPAPIKFVDIAGLVKGAHKGEGLGNKFLAHIREVDLIIIILRTFSDPDIVTPLSQISAKEEFDTIKTELILKDLETCEKHLQKLNKEIKSGDKLARQELEIVKKIIKTLDKNNFAIDAGLPNEDKKLINYLNLLTNKPILVVLNCDEKDLKNPPFIKQLPEERQIEISAKIEAELAEFSDSERNEYLKSIDLEEPGLNRLIRACFHQLNLISFYTFTKDLVQAWPIKKGTKARKAAGIVHTDFAKNFILAEAVNYQDLISVGSWEKAREQGLIKRIGRDGAIENNEIVFFRHSR